MRKKLALSILVFLIACIHVPAQNPYIQHYTSFDGLPSNQVYQVYQDSRKFIWFATDGGVSRFDGSNFTYFHKHDGLSSNNIVRIEEDSRGRIWFFNLNASLDYFFNNTIHNETNAPFLDSLKARNSSVIFMRMKIKQSTSIITINRKSLPLILKTM